MAMISPIVALLFLFCVHPSVHSGPIGWPLYGTVEDGPSESPYVLNVNVGTPPQHLQVVLDLEGDDTGLALADRSLDPDGYSPGESKTFKLVGLARDKHGEKYGAIGRDEIVIEHFTGSKTPLGNLPFVVSLRLSLVSGSGVLSFNHASNGSNRFIDALFPDAKDKAAVVAFGTNPNSPDRRVGTVYLGGRPAECDSRWTVVPEIPFDSKNSIPPWSVELDSIQVGKFTKLRPGPATFQLDSDFLGLPSALYRSISRALGSRGADLNRIPCDSQSSLFISLAHKLEKKQNA